MHDPEKKKILNDNASFIAHLSPTLIRNVGLRNIEKEFSRGFLKKKSFQSLLSPSIPSKL